jgi:predicted DCC family thiol-disulfide oxidoreductase YuxK
MDGAVSNESDGPLPRQNAAAIGSHPIILYDGVCGLCNRFTQFVLRNDAQAVFRFASLQSAFATHSLERNSANRRELETVYVVLKPGQTDELLLSRSDAVIFVLKHLGGIRRVAGYILAWIPWPLRDWGYRWLARNRYRLFGRLDACPVPSLEERGRFLDV